MHQLRRLTVVGLLGCAICGWIVAASVRPADAEDYPSIAANLELMQGHLIASLENYKLGQIPLAQAHAAHPLHEHYRNLPGEFAKDHADLDKLLQGTLARLQQSLTDKVDIQTYAAQVQDAAQLLEQVGMILIPAEIRGTLTFQTAVLIHLLDEVEEEYGEAIADAKVVNLPEYQDAFGFLQRAHTLSGPLLMQMKDSDQQRLHALWNPLQEAIPSIMPPSPPKSAQSVESHVSALVTFLKGVGEQR